MKCPNCGATVFATDQTCVSCGNALTAPASSPKSPRAAAEPSRPLPRIVERRPVSMSWTQRIVAAAGPAWEVCPRIVLGLYLLGVVLYAFALGFPAVGALGVVASAVIVIFGLLYLGFWLWLVADVFANEAEWWWVLVFWFFGPLGMVAYFIWGRASVRYS